MKNFLFLFLALCCMGFGETAQPQPLKPHVLTLFGATGDLAKRKLFPALAHLEKKGMLPEEFALIGIGRKGEELFWKEAPLFIPKEDLKAWESLSKKMIFISGDVEDPKTFEKLRKKINSLNGDRLFYLAIPPSYFPSVIQNLYAFHLMDEKESAVMIEKPFGKDLESARALHQEISQFLNEEQVFRVDHYLGKPGVRNIFLFRSENVDFETYWNRQYIDSVSIILSEDIGIGDRGAYWEETGLLRDVVQNHAMQILSLIGMNMPKEFSSEEIQKEKLRVLKRVRFPSEEFVRGQYEAGFLDGKFVPGYTEEKHVDPNSNVETYVDMKGFIDNERWEGVPFRIQAGKRLIQKSAEVVIFFKDSFSQGPKQLVFQIQLPASSSLPEAYEFLLSEAFQRNRSHFVSFEEIDAAWEIMSPLLQQQTELIHYPAGSSIDVPRENYPEAGRPGP